MVNAQCKRKAGAKHQLNTRFVADLVACIEVVAHARLCAIERRREQLSEALIERGLSRLNRREVIRPAAACLERDYHVMHRQVRRDIWYSPAKTSDIERPRDKRAHAAERRGCRCYANHRKWQVKCTQTLSEHIKCIAHELEALHTRIADVRTRCERGRHFIEAIECVSGETQR